MPQLRQSAAGSNKLMDCCSVNNCPNCVPLSLTIHTLRSIDNVINICHNQSMKKLTAEEIARIQQLRSVGYPMATIAKLFGVDRSVVAYHTKNLPYIQLEDFLKAMMPHTPLEGPPLPKGWSPTWRELSQLFKGSKLAEEDETGRNSPLIRTKCRG